MTSSGTDRVAVVDLAKLIGILDTAPFKWSGLNSSLSRQCGARLAAFFTRIQPFTPEELDAVDTYVCTIPRPPNRYRPVGAALTEAQRRGKAVTPQLNYFQQLNLDAVVHWGDAAEGARILNGMRTRGMKQPYFACDRCASDEFVKLAGQNAEGVICTYPWDPTRKDPKLDHLREAFRQRFPDALEVETYAAHSYDGMNMLIWAIQEAGLNRAKIRDLLAYRNVPWQGVTGEITFSPAMDDIGEVYMAKYENGQGHYLSRDQLGISRAEIRERSKQDQPAASGQPQAPAPTPPPAVPESYR